MLVYVSFFLFFSSLLLVFIQSSHFLSVLLVLEMMTLSLFMMVLSFVGMGSMIMGVGFGLVFLVFGVYEAANGLGLLVSRTRSSGMDQLSGLFSLNL
uniref:NADH-ubiquinone oxidoreductase chain 4L n=1 Tax=Iridona iridescens TaxID=465791 RepID=J3JR23_IRIIR|nr:NADH dehydrogenase subunit 4L [Iridona iridescens]AEV94270.1 NADH dehydrogenase subunit 4L [Iridona iridescens]